MAVPVRRWEARLERHVILHAKKLKLEVYKFTSPGRRGVPDRMFINKRGRICFIELKAPGKTPNPMQDREIKILTARGVLAFWSSEINECKEFLTDFSEL
jgi:hypothetical protein